MAYFLFSRHSTPFLNKVMNARYCENNSQGWPQTLRLRARTVGTPVISSFVFGWGGFTCVKHSSVSFSLCQCVYPGVVLPEELQCPPQPRSGQGFALRPGFKTRRPGPFFVWFLPFSPPADSALQNEPICRVLKVTIEPDLFGLELCLCIFWTGHVN